MIDKPVDLKLIAIDRPGLGASDAHPTKTLSSWVADIRELIGAARHLKHSTAVGFSQSAPFTFALAEAGVVEAIAIVSGQDDLTHPEIRPLLQPDVAQMIAAIEQDAAAFEQHFSQIATAAGLWQLIIEMSAECDPALNHEPRCTSRGALDSCKALRLSFYRELQRFASNRN